MLRPSIFGESLLDDFFRFPFEKTAAADMMKTDIKDTENGYEITMNVPGVKKEDIHAELKDGYLTIQAVSNSGTDEKDKNGRYIRRERYSGSCSRSFFVGEDVNQEDIHGKYEDGTIKFLVPKKEAKPAVEEKKYIAIEG